MAKHLNEKFLDALKYMDQQMRQDTKNGKVWRYTNCKKRYAKFEQARSHNRLTNCVSGVQMGLLMAGLPGACTHWYGAGGKIVYTTELGKKTVPKYFDIIKVNDTVQGLYNKQKLCDGDILIYANMNHTNCYFGGKNSFDSGHAYCTGSGEMAQFKKWIGGLTYKSAKVAYILRLKDRAHYRVQAGAYYDEKKFNEQVSFLAKKGYKTSKLVEDGMFKVQLGYYSGKTNADRLVAELRQKGISAFVREV